VPGPTRYSSSHRSLPLGMDSSHDSLFNSCCTLPTRLFQWDFLFFLLKERKEKKRSTHPRWHIVALYATKWPLKKTLKSFNMNVKWTTILAYCKRSSTLCILGHVLSAKKREREPIGRKKKNIKLNHKP